MCVCLDPSNVLLQRMEAFPQPSGILLPHGWLQRFQGKKTGKTDSPPCGQPTQLNVDYFCVFGWFEVCHSASIFKNYGKVKALRAV